MVNLKEQTIRTLHVFNKEPEDIKWVGCNKFKIPIDEFWELANRYYDNGYGSEEVAHDLLVVGEDWWLERNEYDGSEWWEYKTAPIEPEKTRSVQTLFPLIDTDYKYNRLGHLPETIKEIED